MEAALTDMIDSVVTGQIDPDRLEDAVRLAAEKVAVTMRAQP
jgi:hypothetical protein